MVQISPTVTKSDAPPSLGVWGGGNAFQNTGTYNAVTHVYTNPAGQSYSTPTAPSGSVSVFPSGGSVGGAGGGTGGGSLPQSFLPTSVSTGGYAPGLTPAATSGMTQAQLNEAQRVAGLYNLSQQEAYYLTTVARSPSNVSDLQVQEYLNARRQVSNEIKNKINRVASGQEKSTELPTGEKVTAQNVTALQDKYIPPAQQFQQPTQQLSPIQQARQQFLQTAEQAPSLPAPNQVIQGILSGKGYDVDVLNKYPTEIAIAEKIKQITGGRVDLTTPFRYMKPTETQFKFLQREIPELAKSYGRGTEFNILSLVQPLFKLPEEITMAQKFYLGKTPLPMVNRFTPYLTDSQYMKAIGASPGDITLATGVNVGLLAGAYGLATSGVGLAAINTGGVALSYLLDPPTTQSEQAQKSFLDVGSTLLTSAGLGIEFKTSEFLVKETLQEFPKISKALISTFDLGTQLYFKSGIVSSGRGLASEISTGDFANAGYSAAEIAVSLPAFKFGEALVENIAYPKLIEPKSISESTVPAKSGILRQFLYDADSDYSIRSLGIFRGVKYDSTELDAQKNLAKEITALQPMEEKVTLPEKTSQELLKGMEAATRLIDQTNRLGITIERIEPSSTVFPDKLSADIRNDFLYDSVKYGKADTVTAGSTGLITIKGFTKTYKDITEEERVVGDIDTHTLDNYDDSIKKVSLEKEETPFTIKAKLQLAGVKEATKLIDVKAIKRIDKLIKETKSNMGIDIKSISGIEDYQLTAIKTIGAEKGIILKGTPQDIIRYMVELKAYEISGNLEKAQTVKDILKEKSLEGKDIDFEALSSKVYERALFNLVTEFKEKYKEKYQFKESEFVSKEYGRVLVSQDKLEINKDVLSAFKEIESGKQYDYGPAFVATTKEITLTDSLIPEMKKGEGVIEAFPLGRPGDFKLSRAFDPLIPKEGEAERNIVDLSISKSFERLKYKLTSGKSIEITDIEGDKLILQKATKRAFDQIEGTINNEDITKVGKKGGKVLEQVKLGQIKSDFEVKVTAKGSALYSGLKTLEVSKNIPDISLVKEDSRYVLYKPAETDLLQPEKIAEVSSIKDMPTIYKGKVESIDIEKGKGIFKLEGYTGKGTEIELTKASELPFKIPEYRMNVETLLQQFTQKISAAKVRGGEFGGIEAKEDKDLKDAVTLFDLISKKNIKQISRISNTIKIDKVILPGEDIAQNSKVYLDFSAGSTLSTPFESSRFLLKESYEKEISNEKLIRIETAELNKAISDFKEFAGKKELTPTKKGLFGYDIGRGLRKILPKSQEDIVLDFNAKEIFQKSKEKISLGKEETIGKSEVEKRLFKEIGRRVAGGTRGYDINRIFKESSKAIDKELGGIQQGKVNRIKAEMALSKSLDIAKQEISKSNKPLSQSLQKSIKGGDIYNEYNKYKSTLPKYTAAYPSSYYSEPKYYKESYYKSDSYYKEPSYVKPYYAAQTYKEVSPYNAKAPYSEPKYYKESYYKSDSYYKEKETYKEPPYTTATYEPILTKRKDIALTSLGETRKKKKLFPSFEVYAIEKKTPRLIARGVSERSGLDIGTKSVFSDLKATFFLKKGKGYGRDISTGREFERAVSEGLLRRPTAKSRYRKYSDEIFIQKQTKGDFGLGGGRLTTFGEKRAIKQAKRIKMERYLQ